MTAAIFAYLTVGLLTSQYIILCAHLQRKLPASLVATIDRNGLGLTCFSLMLVGYLAWPLYWKSRF